MDIQISPISKEQIHEVVEFMTDIILQEFGYDINPQWHKDILEFENTYINNSSFAYAAWNKQVLIGTIASRPYDRSYDWTDKYNIDNTLTLWRHYIKKEYRRQGIGNKLLSAVEKRAIELNYKYIYLHTQKTIPGSLEYWISNNYKIINDSYDNFQTVHLEKIII